MDARFIVEAGGTLLYDPAYVDGNFTVQADVDDVAPLMVAPPDLPCVSQCFEDGWNDVNNLTVASNETWALGSIPADANNDDILRIAGTVYVRDGATLTIDDDVRLEFGPNGRIVIERGGRIVADHVAFVSACNAMWHGVEVWGTKDASQNNIGNNPDQGSFHASYCTFENAREAVVVGRTDDPTTGHEYNGGVAQLFGNTFRNNYRSVRIEPTAPMANGVELLNRCQIFYNDFVTDDYLIDHAYHDANGNRLATAQHVLLTGVRRVQVSHNTFSVTPPAGGAFAPHVRGSGIEARDASFIAYNNALSGLSQGIWHEEGAGSITGSIMRNNDLSNCLHSILSVMTGNDLIVDNTINVPVSPQYGYAVGDPNEGYNYPVGIYMLMSHGFRAEGNTVVGNETDGNATKRSYAMVANQCAWLYGSDASHVYLNTFMGTNIALQCEGDNKGDGIDGGLLIECNTFGGTADVKNHDVVVVHNWLDGSDDVDALLRDQGLCIPFDQSKQAGNHFSALDADNDTRDHFYFSTDALITNDAFAYSDRSDDLPISLATNIPTVTSCQTNLPRDCQRTGIGGKPVLEAIRGNLEVRVQRLQTDISSSTDPTEQDSLQRHLEQARGQLSGTLNSLVHFALEYEELDSTYKYLNTGSDQKKWPALAAYYLAKKMTAQADSVIDLINVYYGGSTKLTSLLTVRSDLTASTTTAPNDDILSLLQEMVEQDPLSAMGPYAMLRRYRSQPYFRVPWMFNDTIPGYRGAAQNQADAAPSIAIWPNPATNELFVQSKMEPAIAVELFTADGRSAARAMPTASAAVVRFDLSGLRAGPYLLRVQQGSVADVFKVVVVAP